MPPSVTAPAAAAHDERVARAAANAFDFDANSERGERALRQLQPFCDHEDWEKDGLGKMSPGERLGAR